MPDVKNSKETAKTTSFQVRIGERMAQQVRVLAVRRRVLPRDIVTEALAQYLRGAK
jgi:hypothetical protein